MNYSAWKYLYPPRPDNVITSDMLALYEQRGWWGQYKKNGTCVSVTVDPQGGILICDRHGDKLKSWQCPPWLGAFVLQQVPAKRWTMLIAELMHSKTPTIKDTLYFRDVIVYQNEHLIGSTFKERQKILDGMFPMEGTETYSHWEISAGIWRAKNLTSGFAQRFLDIENPRIDEGFVLVNPSAPLKWCIKAESNSSWCVKCRYPTKNYQF